jgi:hypothetical protein
MDAMAITMLRCSSLKFNDMSLFIGRVIVCIQTSDLNVFDPEGSSPVNVVEILN